MDWNRVLFETRTNNLHSYLLSIPQSQWSIRDPQDDETILHYAARGDNRKALILLVKSGININTICNCGYTPFDIAFRFGRKETVELFCVLRANMTRAERFDRNSIDTHVKILISNGYRVTKKTNRYLSFQCGILKARSAVVALLKLYKSYETCLNRIGCKYMMRELVVSVWATRTTEDWQE